MECPFCRHKKTEIYNSRQSSGSSRVWRRRRCMSCQKPFTTYEAADMGFMTIIKNNGSQEPYTRVKLLLSLYHACNVNNDYAEAIDALASTIESDLLDLGKPVLQSDEITRTTLAVLKRYDPAVFLRYLSQRGDFASMEQLKRELQEL